MLPSLRAATARCFPGYARKMSSGGSLNDQGIVAEAMGALGVPTTSTPPPPPAVPAASASASSSSKPPTSTIMNIPPAEDPLLHYFTSSLLHHGHRARAARITSHTLLHIHALTRAPPLPLLRKAVLDAAPAVRTLMHKRGGKTVAKPVALGEKQRTRRAVQAILKASKGRMGRTVEERLARELIAVVQGSSKALEEKEAVHRFAMVNRGNAQTRV